MTNHNARFHNRINALKQTCFQEQPESAVCVQHSLDSRNSAIHSAYRILLRPSSLSKPRDPSLRVVKKITTVFIIEKRFSKGEQWYAPTASKDGNAYPGRIRIREIFHQPTQYSWFEMERVNDPSAGSPTETLLRLLLPLSVKVH